MNRIVNILLVVFLIVVILFVALFLAAYLKPKHNQIPIWKTDLEQIYSAKQLWEINNINKTNDSPRLDDLRPYLSSKATTSLFWTNSVLMDLSGTVYTIGRIGEPPSCLIGGVRKVFPKF